MPDRLYDPEEITRRSYEHIDRRVDLGNRSELERAVIKRVIHTTGDFDIQDNLWFSTGLESAVGEVIGQSLPVVTDVSMVGSGIRSGLLGEAGLETYSYVHDDAASQRADEEDITRSAAGLDLALREFERFMLVVGNAPTVLFRLLDRSDATPERVPLVVGSPVGFVSVEESKDELLNSEFTSVGVSGNRGGSPVAASITNALLRTVLEDHDE